MKKRYKVVFNVEIADPDQPFSAGGDYTHLSRIRGVVHLLTGYFAWPDRCVVTLDKLIDKGELLEVDE